MKQPYHLLTALLFCLFFWSAGLVQAQQPPRIGAQIWIEPGQKPEQIDQWFRLLAEHKMPVCRLFIMWNYVQPAPDRWNWSLYDQAFASAQKHGVKIVATLTANHGPAFADPYYFYKAQDGRIPQTEEQLLLSETYITQLVKRYAAHPALDTWMLQNEPGQLPTADPLAMGRFRTWLQKKYGQVDRLNAAWLTAFTGFEQVEYSPLWEKAGGFVWPNAFLDWNNFWREHLTWYMEWVAGQIRKHDSKTPLHVNPHAVFEILPKYELPKWRGFLTSLGASIHPGWHFSLLKRNQYALGISGICDIIKGASEPNPFWVTELQGGNNLYSATQPLCPTSDDIAEWVWTSVGSGAERVIFWCLNYRATGGEAAEWSMLDFQNRPTERLKKAGEIAALLEKEAAFFAPGVTQLPTPVTILLSKESMLVQARKDTDGPAGRGAYAHIQSALSMYQALAEMGIPASLKEFDDYDWESAPESSLLLVPNAVALTAEQVERLRKRAERGAKLLVTGQTGLFNEQEHAWVYDQPWPLEKLVGGRLKEIIMEKEEAELQLSLSGERTILPVHYWKGFAEATTGTTYGEGHSGTTAIRHKIGRGEVVWIPSLIELGSWQEDNQALARLLALEAAPFTSQLPIRFEGHYPDMLMRTLRNKRGQLMTVIVNSHDLPQSIRLVNTTALRPRVVYGMLSTGRETLSLGAHHTVVIAWE